MCVHPLSRFSNAYVYIRRKRTLHGTFYLLTIYTILTIILIIELYWKVFWCVVVVRGHLQLIVQDDHSPLGTHICIYSIFAMLLASIPIPKSAWGLMFFFHLRFIHWRFWSSALKCSIILTRRRPCWCMLVGSFHHGNIKNQLMCTGFIVQLYSS